MQYLSSDLIRYIGCFLTDVDKRRCREASKLFNSVTHNISHFNIVIFTSNYATRIIHLQDIVKSIARISSPDVRRTTIDVHFKFATLEYEQYTILAQQLSAISTLPYKLRVFINRCSYKTEQIILAAIPRNLEVRVITCGSKHIIDPTQNVGYYEFKAHTDTQVNEMIQQLRNCKEIFIHNRICSTSMNICFDPIDITKNTELVVHDIVFDSQTYSEPHKITRLHCSLSPCTFMQSCLADPLFTSHSRMKEIVIEGNISSDVSLHHITTIWKTLIRIMPQDVVYSFIPSTPSCIGLIDVFRSYGAANFSYTVDNQTLYLKAQLCKRLALRYDFPVKHVATFTPSVVVDHTMSTRDIYELLPYTMDTLEWMVLTHVIDSSF